MQKSRDDGGLDHGGSLGYSEKWSDSGHNLKVGPPGFADRADGRSNNRRDIDSFFKVSELRDHLGGWSCDFLRREIVGGIG